MAKMRPVGRVRAAVHEGARSLFVSNAIDAKEMAEFDSLCLVPVPYYLNGRKLRKLRRRFKLKQESLAQILNTSVETVRRWETGQTRPRGAALRLLQLLDCKGVDAAALDVDTLGSERKAAVPRG